MAQNSRIRQIVLVLLILSMVAFYATSFDSITLVASAYSYRKLAGRVGTDENDGDKAEEDNEQAEASSGMKLFWAILLIMLPIALLFSESSMNNLQTVSIIAAFPVGIVILLIIASFLKDAKQHMEQDS
jgi:BCCT family betaine/carnitine transporter